MRRGIAALVGAWLATVALAACGGGGPAPAPAPAPPPPTQAELDDAQAVLDLVNEERTAMGLGTVVLDEIAAQAAYGHAYDMEVREFFGHENPSGEWPWDRLNRWGATYLETGENIAQGYPTPEDVVAAWMGSPDHRANILRPSWGRLGVGVRHGPGGPWWVQEFLGP